MNRRTLTVLLLLAALFAFAVAFVLAAGWVNGGNYPAWLAGGLAVFVAVHLSERLP